MKLEAIVARYKSSPIIIHASVLLALLYFMARYNVTNGIVMFICFMFLILAHELGHAFYAKKYGYFVSEIKLFPIGGHCKYLIDEYEQAPVLIPAGGLIAQLILLGLFGSLFLFLKLIGADSLLFTIKPITDVFIYINILLIIFNSLPVPGLDGYELIPHVMSFFKKKRTHNHTSVNNPKTQFRKKSRTNTTKDNNVVDIAQMRKRKNKDK